MTDLIDMKQFSGEVNDPVAGGQQMGANSFQQESTEDYPVHKEFLVQPEQQVEQAPSAQDHNFKALREEIERVKTQAEADKREYQQNLELMRANSRQPEKPRQMFDGMEGTEIPNVAEIRNEWAQREADYQAKIEELQVQQQHSDYVEVMRNHLTPLLKQKPHLAEGIQGARNKALFAYELGKMAQQMQATPPVQTQPSVTAQRIVDNARKPGSMASVGGQGTLSQADHYATMSDTEFMQLASKYLE